MGNPTKISHNLFINYDLCLNCERCLAQKSCTTKAIIRIDLDEPPFIDVHRCHGCLLCLAECPQEAIKST
jgi:Pyruvate/2-oxoacid:ferredoxin oxidoreductase delta subunit